MPSPPNSAPNKSQERPSGACRMQENLSGQGSAAGPTEGAYSAPVFLAGGEGAGCPIPKKSTPVLSPSGLGPGPE